MPTINRSLMPKNERNFFDQMDGKDPVPSEILTVLEEEKRTDTVRRVPALLLPIQGIPHPQPLILPNHLAKKISEEIPAKKTSRQRAQALREIPTPEDMAEFGLTFTKHHLTRLFSIVSSVLALSILPASSPATDTPQNRVDTTSIHPSTP